MRYIECFPRHRDLEDKSTDYLYNSNNLEDLLLFYERFDDREKIIEWMRRRPRLRGRIVEFQGDDNVVVVVPTINANSEMVTNLRHNVFRGLRLIAVESGETPFFSYSQNVNYGISYAMKYNPKFVIVSNDDVYKIDDVKILLEQLFKIPENGKNVIYTNPPGKYNSYWVNLGKPTIFRDAFYLLSNKYLRTRIHIEKQYKNILSLKYMCYGQNFPYSLFLRSEYKIKNMGALSIFSNKFIKNNQKPLFDETYINGMEDIDLSIRISELEKEIEIYNIDYRIGAYMGKSLGKFASIRTLRQIVNLVYFNYKIENSLISFQNNKERSIQL